MQIESSEEILYNQSLDLFLKYIIFSICEEITEEIENDGEYLNNFLLKLKTKLIKKIKNRNNIYLTINEGADFLFLNFKNDKDSVVYYKVSKTKKGLEITDNEVGTGISKKIYRNIISEFIID